jgi:hypothetical protein
MPRSQGNWHGQRDALRALYSPNGPETQNPAGGRGFAEAQIIGLEQRDQHTAGGSVARLLDRLERVRKAGKGWSARCPAHEDRTASLSLTEGTDGRALLHCFAGCGVLDVVQAIGLDLADLYPERLTPTTPEQRRELREFARIANWRSALNMLAFEAAIVEVAAKELLAGKPLSETDTARLSQAVERIADARAVLQ